MKTNILLLGFFVVAICNLSLAQNKFEPCISNTVLQENISKNPQILEDILQLENETKSYELAQQNQSKSIAAVKIIPVVFHIIHQYGTENITRAQCLDQIRILNEDYRHMNPDTNTAAAVAFSALAADCNIEFRIAQIDPNGNCTDGVNHVYSPLTAGAYDNVKSLIYWPRNQYLNIWVVKYITSSSSSTQGYVIGFAQFPGGGSAATDGVVVRYDFLGNIGAAAGERGRTATHEVGHWLNLRHIWGDDGTACTGSDNVSDTPNQGAENFSTCPTFPHISCSNGPNGDMFNNYMDYTAAACQNMFSIGQSTRMNAALSSTTSGRSNLWSAANLTATGVNNTATLCKPVADFTPHVPTYICAGSTVTVADKSWGGTATSRTWYFDGGIPATSTALSPTVTYATPGTYNISYTVANATGTDSITKTGVVIVLPTTSNYQTNFSEGFENSNIPNSDWTVINYEPTSVTFARTNAAAYSGTYSCKLAVIDNDLQNDVDELISPSFDLTTFQAPKLTFRQAYAQTTEAAASDNKLVVQYSTSCGKTWSSLPNGTYTGTSLATSAINDNNFIPAASEWVERTIPLNNYTSFNNIRFRFKFTGAVSGNNLYLDDINIAGTNTGINDLVNQNFDFSIIPNPATSQANVDFTLIENSNVTLDVYDAIGKLVMQKNFGKLNAGKQNLNLYSAKEPLNQGVYFVKLMSNKSQTTKKLVIQ